jgi:homoserine dehydrogenase
MRQTEPAAQAGPVEGHRVTTGKEVRVGIIGYGTVGRATAEILTHNAEEIRSRTGGIALRVTRLCRKTGGGVESGPSGIAIESDWKKIVEAGDVDIVVEAIGGTDTAYDVVRASLENNKAVVTANKALIARHGDQLFALANERKLPIGIEATVGGGIPIVRAISDALSADRIQAVYGIINGTCNFILTKMEGEGLEFGEALAQAQAAGYAEADPSLDIDGLDARDKISILARLAFHGAVLPEQIPAMGIRQVAATDFHYAGRLGSTIRLVASAERAANGINISVRPWLVRRDSMLAKVDGPNNAIFLAGERAGTQMFYGQGAGGGATGTAVLSDVVQIARHLGQNRRSPNAHLGFQHSGPLPLCESSRPVSWYLRLTVRDRPGILAHAAQAIAQQGISIDSVIQEPHMPKEKLSFVITLEPVRESVVQKAVAAINQLEFMIEPVLLLPMVSAAG